MDASGERLSGSPLPSLLAGFDLWLSLAPGSSARPVRGFHWRRHLDHVGRGVLFRRRLVQDSGAPPVSASKFSCRKKGCFAAGGSFATVFDTRGSRSGLTVNSDTTKMLRCHASLAEVKGNSFANSRIRSYDVWPAGRHRLISTVRAPVEKRPAKGRNTSDPAVASDLFRRRLSSRMKAGQNDLFRTAPW